MMESLKMTLEAKHEQQKTGKPPQVHLFKHDPPQSSHFPCKTEDMIHNLYLTSATLIEASHFDEMLASY